MSKGVTQKCRLLLEGREIPFTSATLICNDGEPITAIIDTVPLKVIKFIRPKTQVQIFVRDSLMFGDLDFHLAFEGETVGRSMGKRQDSRTFQITAIDYSGYWDEARAFFYNHNFLVGKVTDVVVGNPSLPDQAKAGGMTELRGVATLGSQMVDMITAKENGGDIAAGIANVFKKLDQVNLFYKAAWSRLRISDRVRVFTGGKIGTFLKDIKIEDFLAAFAGQQGGMISLKQMLLEIMGLVFHGFVTVPFPSRVPVHPIVGGKPDYSSKVGETIGSFLFVPDGYSLPAPKCNVIFPNQIASFELRDDFRAPPTRFAFRASMPGYVQGNTPANAYPMQYYPKSFSDYMFHTASETDQDMASALGSSSILHDKTGKRYVDLEYGGDKKTAVGGVSVSPRIREADFLTNEESIRGITLDTETLTPGMTALAQMVSPSVLAAFTGKVGEYLFYKKRFASRNATAQLMFHPFLCPGFNTVIVDDSDAGQTVIAKLQSVVHNLSNQGCSTSVTLGYARDFDEVDFMSGGAGDPPVPQWFDNSIFGKVDSAAYKNETDFLKKRGLLTDDEAAAREKIDNAVAFVNINRFYRELLGCDAITDIGGTTSSGEKNDSSLCTPRGAAVYLSESFRRIAGDDLKRDAFFTDYIRRSVPTMADTMYFLGAKPAGVSGIIPDEFARFEAVSDGPLSGRFDGRGYEDDKILAIRREVVDAYVELLKEKRGFRG